MKPGSAVLDPARVPAWGLAAITFVIAVTLYRPDADGAFAIYDGAWYGHFAEHLTQHSILPHHPLFHLVVAGLTRLLAAAGVASPGHMAVRVVAGIGGGLVLWMIARLAGPDRRWIGAAFAFALFTTRGFISETATGENLFPAFAAALFLFQTATADAVNIGKLVFAATLALCLRQDSLFLLPGALIAAAPGLPEGRRLRSLAVVIAASGVVTFGFYVIAWAWAHGATHEDLWSYLTRFGRIARWEGQASVSTNLLLHFGGLGAALVGRIWFAPTPHILVGAGWVAAVLVAMLLTRGTKPSGRYAAAVLTTIAIRMPFYTWFEPQNFEWQLLPITLLLALGARNARGAPATSRAQQWIGGGLLVAAGVAVLAVHAENTWLLRRRRLAEAVDQVIEAAGKNAWYLPMDKNAMLALELRHRQYDQLDIPYGAPISLLADLVIKKHDALGRPIAMVGDRYVETGMPYDLVHAGEGFKALDAIQERPGLRVLRYEGKVFAAILFEK